MNPSATESSAGSVVIATWRVVMRGIFLRMSMMAGSLWNVMGGKGVWKAGRWVGTGRFFRKVSDEVQKICVPNDGG